jgi:hypothetical protein
MYKDLRGLALDRKWSGQSLENLIHPPDVWAQDPDPVPLGLISSTLLSLQQASRHDECLFLLSQFYDSLKFPKCALLHDVPDEDVSFNLLSLFDSSNLPIYLGLLLQTFVAWTYHCSGCFRHFLEHPTFIAMIFDIALTDTTPRGCEDLECFQLYAIQILANLAEESSGIADRLIESRAVNLFLDSISDPEDVGRVRSVCRLMTSLLKWRPLIPACETTKLLDKLFSLFEFRLAKCESDGFLFLSRFACHSKWFNWNFQNRIALPGVFERLCEYRDDQIKDIFWLVDDLLEFGRINPPSEEDVDSEFWWEGQVQVEVESSRLPFGIFILCMGQEGRGAPVKLSYLSFIRNLIKEQPMLVGLIGSKSFFTLLSDWIGGDALEVRRSAARTFCEFAQSNSPTVIDNAVNQPLLQNLCSLLADFDEGPMVERIVRSVLMLVVKVVRDFTNLAEMTMEVFEEGRIFEKFEEMAMDGDVEEKVADLARQVVQAREMLGDLLERQQIEREKKKDEETKAIFRQMPSLAFDRDALWDEYDDD